MPWPVHPNGLLGAQGDNDTYQISRSLRFNSADSAYLSRTPSSAGNRKTWTWSAWVKRGKIDSSGTQYQLFTVNNANNDTGTTEIYISLDTLSLGAFTVNWRRTTQIFRDPSAWYHLVFSIDTTQATAANRIRIYVNGSEITSFSTSNNPTQNADLGINSNTAHYIGSEVYGGPTAYFDGYLTEINFIDGQALTPSSFGETDAVTGRWKAKAYSGSYGTNGFYLKFADNSSTAALGTDSSGNGNTWTTNNFSVTAGAGNDSLVDSPTNYGSDSGVGGTVRGNYCTLNPLDKGSSATLSDGNLVLSLSAASSVRGTIGVSSGKWYWETTWGGTSGLIGIAKGDTLLSSYVGRYVDQWAYAQTGEKYTGNVGLVYGATFTTGDIIGVALNADSGQLTFYKNGASQGVAYSGLTSGPYFPAFGDNSATTNHVTNFGQRPFAYTAPSGFKALCTTNLSTPTIKKPSSYFDVVTYTGDGASSRSITSLGFNPDFLWLKSRSNAYSHRLADAVRGAGKELFANETSVESTNASDGYVSSFNSNGFTLTTPPGGVAVNANGLTYVAWAWDEAPIAGMDIVSYTGTGTDNLTFNHNLNVTPAMVIIKARSVASESWNVWHKSLAASTYFLRLQTTDSVFTSLPNRQKAQSSTTITLGTDSEVNQNGGTYISYLFAEIEGFSKFGSYTGNGSADGPFVFCGFRPRYLFIKNTAGGSWEQYDTARDIYNQASLILEPNSSGAEQTAAGYVLDLVSNGFKIRGTASGINTNANTFIFAAFAEQPFKYARAR